jgi:hypothetical protein
VFPPKFLQIQNQHSVFSIICDGLISSIMKFNTDRVLESVRTLKIINKNGDVDLESNNGSYQVNNNNARDRTNEKGKYEYLL